jgi:homocysteine S-methyltransferase
MQGKHRRHLPQLDGGLFLTDGGFETSLIFNDGIDLPHFAAVDLLLRRQDGEAALWRYFRPYVAIAAPSACSKTCATRSRT